MKWKPFDTAPKDGSEILAYGYYMYPGDTDRTEYWYIVSYNKENPYYPWDTDSDESFQDEIFYSWSPLTRPKKSQLNRKGKDVW